MWPAWIKNSWIKKIEIVDPPDGLEAPCWLWRGASTPDAYPRANISNGKMGGEAVYLHRFVFEQHHHEKLGVDDGGHLCGRSLCIQHEHIERQTRKYNRGSSTARRFEPASFLPAEELAALADNWWLLGRSYC